MLRKKHSEAESLAQPIHTPIIFPAEARTDDLEERFQEAIEHGEIDGDAVLVDAQGREVKEKKPLVSIFDL